MQIQYYFVIYFSRIWLFSLHSALFIGILFAYVFVNQYAHVCVNNKFLVEEKNRIFEVSIEKCVKRETDTRFKYVQYLFLVCVAYFFFTYELLTVCVSLSIINPIFELHICRIGFCMASLEHFFPICTIANRTYYIW